MSEEKTKFCPYCGVQIEKKYSICPNCGKPQPQIEGEDRIRTHHRKNVLLAVILSLLITGSGQIYLGRLARGLFFLGFVLLISILLEEILKFDELMIIGVAISLISAWDAYRLATKINEP